MSLGTLAQSPEFTLTLDRDGLAGAVKSWHVASRIIDALEGADMLPSDRDYVIAALNAYGSSQVTELVGRIEDAMVDIERCRKEIEQVVSETDDDDATEEERAEASADRVRSIAAECDAMRDAEGVVGAAITSIYREVAD